MKEDTDQFFRGSNIGRGSFGTVSLAFHKSNGQPFAVKSASATQNPLTTSSLDNEIEILGTLKSEYIVSYLGNSRTNQHRNLHMEYMPNGTIADVAGKIDERRIRDYTSCITKALAYLHCTAGVVHCDVKGRNVLLGSKSGSAKLSDFGCARRMSGESGSMIGGTPMWMAPEVVRGETASAESDVWSLGCTVIEMVKGGNPWGEGLGKEMLFRIGYGDELPELPSGLSEAGRSFVDKCLRRKREERWTVEELLQHPFLKDEDDGVGEIGCSPRSVFDWVDLEFDEEDGGGKGSCDVVMELGMERLIGLINGGGDMDWENSEGWELVRWSYFYQKGE